MIITILRSFISLIITILGIIRPCNLYPFLCKILLWAINVDIVDIKGNDIEENFPIIFNHPNPFDHIILMAALKKPLSFVAKKEYVYGPSEYIGKKLGCIFVENGKTVDQMKTAFKSGKRIAIAPAGGQRIDSPYKLDEFRSGGFVISEYVVPVVIKYWPFDYWKEGETLISVLMRRFRGDSLKCSVIILPKMKSDKEYVKAAMENELINITYTKKNKISKSLIWSNIILFGLFAINNNISAILGIFWIIITSVWYNLNNSENVRFINILGNFILVSYFSIIAIIKERI